MIVVSICLGILFLLIGGFVSYSCFESIHRETRIKGIVTLIITGLLIIGVIAGTIWYYNNTESGKRELKDWESNVQGGITRTVTVYDVNGKAIQKYEGKFDISYDTSRIKFDDENGKRHIIYYTTGTVIIDEK